VGGLDDDGNISDFKLLAALGVLLGVLGAGFLGFYTQICSPSQSYLQEQLAKELKELRATLDLNTKAILEIKYKGGGQ
jgi:hypothetical protein